MNISELNTPAELVAANEATKTPFEKAVEALGECNYDDTKTVILWLVHNMTEFHQERSTDSDCNDPLAWARDFGRLEVAFNTLKNTL